MKSYWSFFVGCQPEDILLVQNVTTALNSIFKSLQLKQTDVIFSLSIEYGKNCFYFADGKFSKV